jgi:hypothetical protein
MATTSKALFRGAAATSSTTLYTVPSSTNTVVTNIVVDNTSASEQTFTINLNGIALLSSAVIAANASAFFDLKQVLATTQTITGLASATSVTFHISGVEIN